MILHCLRERIRRWVCPQCENCDLTANTTRLERAEKLHAMSSLAVSREAEKQVRRVSDMRIAANAAVKRLVHDKHQIEERDGSDF
jgi:hypothetical protein